MKNKKALESMFNMLKSKGLYKTYDSYEDYNAKQDQLRAEKEEDPYKSVERESEQAIQDQNNEDIQRYE